MAAYDPKRPRPAELADDPPPVDALLETGEDQAPDAEGPAVEPELTVVQDAMAEPTRQGSDDRGVGVRVAADVPVAPAPEVGTTNRAVLYASLGAGAVLVAVLVVLRLRRRPPGSAPSS